MLYQKLQEDLKAAQLNREELRVSVLRMLLSELRYAEIRKREGERSELSDEEVISVVQREVKKRKEAQEAFLKGGRDEQAAKEEAEAKMLGEYLPTQISDEELFLLVDEAISQLGASSMADMGKVIGYVKSKAGNQADGARISGIVKEKLSGK